MPPPRENALAIAGADGRITVQREADASETHITEALRTIPGEQVQAFDWPVWSPDASRITLIKHLGGGGDDILCVARCDGQDARILHEAHGERPIYASWSPDGSHVAFLTASSPGITLYAVPADGASPATSLISGSPLYLAWTPDSHELLVHVGGSVAANPNALLGCIDVATGQFIPVDLPPAEFRAPSWPVAASGALVALREPGGQEAIAVVSPTKKRAALKYFQGKAAFLRSPNGNLVAYALSPDSRSPTFDQGIHITEPDGSDDRDLATGPILAFFWSPDATQLAYIGVDSMRRGLDLYTTSADGSNRRLLVSFSPSQSYAFLVGFFDQYAQAMSVWSEDSRLLTYAGKTYHHRDNGHGAESQDSVFVLPADGSEPPMRVADGSLGVFAPEDRGKAKAQETGN